LLQTNTQSDRAQHSLALTQHQIDSVTAALVTNHRELDGVRGQVSTDSTALARDAAQLHGVQEALTSAQANVTHQTSIIDDLQACLDGVEQASNALAVGDQTGAIIALDAVYLSCAGAVASNG
jgi:hypothetical protein